MVLEPGSRRSTTFYRLSDLIHRNMVSYSTEVNFGPGPRPILKPICTDRARIRRGSAAQKGPKRALGRTKSQSNPSQGVSWIELVQLSQEEVGNFTAEEYRENSQECLCGWSRRPSTHPRDDPPSSANIPCMQEGPHMKNPLDQA